MFTFLLRTSTFHALYNCAVCDFFVSIILFISWCLRLLIAYQSVMKGVFNIMSRPNTSWTDMACNVVFYVLHTDKAVADIIPDQGSFSSR